MPEAMLAVDDYQARHARALMRSGPRTIYSIPETPTADGFLGGYVLVHETDRFTFPIRKFTFLDEAVEALRVAEEAGDLAAHNHLCGATRDPSGLAPPRLDLREQCK